MTKTVLGDAEKIRKDILTISKEVDTPAVEEVVSTQEDIENIILTHPHMSLHRENLEGMLSELESGEAFRVLIISEAVKDTLEYNNILNF